MKTLIPNQRTHELICIVQFYKMAPVLRTSCKFWGFSNLIFFEMVTVLFLRKFFNFLTKKLSGLLGFQIQCQHLFPTILGNNGRQIPASSIIELVGKAYKLLTKCLITLLKKVSYIWAASNFNALSVDCC